MYLIVTIDTEEDSWGPNYGGKETFLNIERIPALQELFDRHGVTPTYLVTYPVAASEMAVSILKGIQDDGRCEIGTHPHAWNTPPVKEPRVEKDTILYNLPADLQFEKIHTLHRLIEKNFEKPPTSFRSGRWGMNREGFKVLEKIGYQIDSSITPYTDWSYISGPDFSKNSPFPYRVELKDGNGKVGGSALYEVPPTIGYLQDNYEVCSSIDRMLSNSFLKYFHIKRFFNTVKILNKVWLSPEVSSVENMVSLVTRLRRKNVGIINMFFHSQSLYPGLSPFVADELEREYFLCKIEYFLMVMNEMGVKSISLSDAAKIIKKTI
jgi:hypothetical protein